jgi:hypothetical protein
MADPSIGSVKYAHSRYYLYINPDPNAGPPTYRLTYPEHFAGGGGGAGGNATSYDFDGVPPIDVDMTPGVGGNSVVVETSLDFIQLNRRDA